MDWIHCNLCLQQPQTCSPSTRTALYLTSCGHIFCGNCLSEGAQDGNCKICKSECSTLKLATDMKPEIKDFFSEPDEMLIKVKKILDFQKQHRVKLTAHRVALEYKYMKSRNEIKRLTEIVEKMYSDIKKLHHENKSLKFTLSTYLNTKQNSPFAMSTPKIPVYASPTNTTRSASRPFCDSVNVNKMHQLFQSNSVTPHRIRRPNDYCNTGSGTMNGISSLLTPISTISPKTPKSK